MLCYGGVEYEKKGKEKEEKEKKGGKGKLSALLWQSRICIPCVMKRG